MQVRFDFYTSNKTELKNEFEASERSLDDLDEGNKRFFKLFQDSTKNGSEAAALEMMKIAKLQSKAKQELLCYQSRYVLVRASR